VNEITVWLIHAPAGTIALIAATRALFAEKGAAKHRKAGAVFTVSMAIMLLSGFVLAALKESVEDMFLSAVVLYTVATAWLSAHRTYERSGYLEFVALAWISAVAIIALAMYLDPNNSVVRGRYLFWLVIAVFCVLGDLRNLFVGGLTGAQRLLRHVWRLGFSVGWSMLAVTDKALKIAGYSVEELPESLLLYVLAVTTAPIVILTAYWIIHIRFFSGQKYESYRHL